MNCSQAKELISLYIDEQLTGVDKINFEIHLKECPDCLKETKILADIVSNCNGFEEIELPKDFKISLREKLNQQAKPMVDDNISLKKDNKIFDIRRFYNMPTFKLASVVAAVLLVMIISFSTLNDKILNKEFLLGKYLDMPTQEGAADPTVDKGMAYDEGERSEDDFVAMEDQKNLFNAPPTDVNAAISSAQLKLAVSDYDGSVKSLHQKLQEFEGTVQTFREEDFKSDSLSKGQSAKQAFYSIKMPQKNFESFLAYLPSLGKVLDKRVQGSNVTTKYSEIDIDIKNLSIQEQRISEQISKSKSAEDVILLERELSRIKSEIEKNETLIKELDNLKYYSSIELQIIQGNGYNIVSEQQNKDLWKRTKGGFIITTKQIIDFLGNTIVFLGTWLPLMILLLVFTPALVRFIKRKKEDL